MASTKLIKFISLLSRMSDRDQVDWKVSPSTNSYQASFSNNTITIQDIMGDVRLSISDNFGEEIYKLTEDDLDDSGLAEELKKIHRLARNKALGTDELFEKLTNELIEKDL